MTAPGLPPDPFVNDHDPEAEALALGEVVLAALKDATVRDGLLGLYPAVAALGRRELVPAVLVTARDVLTGRVPDRAEAEEQDDDDLVGGEEPTEGDRLLAEVVRPVLRGGFGAVGLEVALREDRELRAILRDRLEVAWTRAKRRRREEG